MVSRNAAVEAGVPPAVVVYLAGDDLCLGGGLEAVEAAGDLDVAEPVVERGLVNGLDLEGGRIPQGEVVHGEGPLARAERDGAPQHDPHLARGEKPRDRHMLGVQAEAEVDARAGVLARRRGPEEVSDFHEGGLVRHRLFVSRSQLRDSGESQHRTPGPSAA